MTQPSFGRRAHPARPAEAPMPVMTKFSRAGNAPAKPPAPSVPASSVDEEIKAWKQARGFAFPIRLLALMASLCFGIASFVLPETINDWVQYPLYALSAASLYVGFRRKRAAGGKPRP